MSALHLLTIGLCVIGTQAGPLRHRSAHAYTYGDLLAGRVPGAAAKRDAGSSGEGDSLSQLGQVFSVLGGGSGLEKRGSHEYTYGDLLAGYIPTENGKRSTHGYTYGDLLAGNVPAKQEKRGSHEYTYGDLLAGYIPTENGKRATHGYTYGDLLAGHVKRSDAPIDSSIPSGTESSPSEASPSPSASSSSDPFSFLDSILRRGEDEPSYGEYPTNVDSYPSASSTAVMSESSASDPLSGLLGNIIPRGGADPLNILSILGIPTGGYSGWTTSTTATSWYTTSSSTTSPYAYATHANDNYGKPSITTAAAYTTVSPLSLYPVYAASSTGEWQEWTSETETATPSVEYERAYPTYTTYTTTTTSCTTPTTTTWTTTSTDDWEKYASATPSGLAEDLAYAVADLFAPQRA